MDMLQERIYASLPALADEKPREPHLPHDALFAPPAAPQMQEAHAFLHGLRVVQPRRTWLGQTAYAVSRVELGNLKKKFLRQQGKQP